MSRTVIVGQTIVLEITLQNVLGQLSDADSTPSVEIRDANNNIVRNLSSAYVSRISTGRYGTSYLVPANGPTGIWTDRWVATLDGLTTTDNLNFTVSATAALINEAGPQIGDDPNISYAPEEILGINILLAKLKARLKNNLNTETLDEYGNKTFVECTIFSNEELTWFLECSLSEFNQTPHFTDFTFDMEVIYNRFSHVIVDGALLVSLLAQSLIENGKEFNINDNGISITPPQLSSTMSSYFNTIISQHRETLKFIKNSIKPSPVGFGTFRVLGSANPAINRLRHLRARRII